MKLFENADVTIPVPGENNTMWTRIFFENGIKKFRFQVKTDTCGQAKTKRIRYCVDANFLKMEIKSCVFK